MARTYETSIVLGAKLATTFKSITGSAGKSLEKLTAQSKALESASKGAGAFAKLGTEVQAARAKFAAAAFAEKQLATAALGATKPTREEAVAMKAAAAATKDAERELKRAEKALDKTGGALRKAGVDTSKLAQEQHRLQGELAATERRTNSLTSAQKAHSRIFGDKGIRERIFGDPKEARVDKFGRQVRGLLGDAAKLAAVGVGAGVGLFAILKKAADAGDSIDDVSKRLHIGASALQAFRLQGTLAGASADDVDAGIGKLAVNIGKVLAARKKGGGGLGPVEGLTIFGASGGAAAGKGDPFKSIGLNARALAKLKPDEQIERIADAIAKLPTQSERSAAAVATMGKSAIKLLPVLEKGGAAFRKFREEGERTGQFIGTNAAQDASDFNDALTELEHVGINSVVNALSGSLLPVGTRTMKDLTKWIGENQDKIRAWAKSAATWIEGAAIPAIKSAGTWFLDTGGKIADMAAKAAKLVGGFDNLAIALVALRVAPLAKTSFEIVAALVRMTTAASNYGGALNSAAKAAGALAGATAGVGVGVATGDDAFSKTGGAIAGGIAGIAAAFIPVIGPAIAPIVGGVAAAVGTWAIDKIGDLGNPEKAGNKINTSPAAREVRIKIEHTGKGGIGRGEVEAGAKAAGPTIAEQVRRAMEADTKDRLRVSFA